MKRTTLVHVSVLFLMLTGVTTLFLLTQSYDQDTHFQRQLNLQSIKRWEARLHQDLLQTRAEFLPHYQELLEAKNELHDLYDELVSGKNRLAGLGLERLDELIVDLGQLLEKKTELLEQFQAKNTRLHNSMRYLPSGVKGLIDIEPDESSRQRLNNDAGHLLQSLLLYIQQSTGERKYQVLTDLQILKEWQTRFSLEGQEDLDALVSHIESIVLTTQTLDTLVPQFLEMPTEIVLNEMIQVYNSYQTTLSQEADRYRFALYLLSILLVLYVGLMLFRLQQASQALAKSKDELELQVTARTAELSQTNSALEQQIHVRQEAQRAEERSREVADQANRAKSDFLANMSHEFRTPLNGILGYTQILKRDLSLGINQQKGVGIIHQSGNHLLALVNDMLDLSKIEARKIDINLQTFNLSECLHAIVNLNKVRAEQKSLQFIFLTNPKLPVWVQGDVQRLRQVLLNLLGNAIKFTNTGTVTFQIHVQGEKGDRRQLRFEVEDTGPGIAPDKLETIFQPFQQIRDELSQVEGTGLGLTICQRLMQAMGGEIHVASISGKGSRFWILLDLPEVLTPETKQEGTTATVIAYEGNTRHVIVVDTHMGNRSMLTDLLRPIGFAVTEAGNAQEGMTLAKECRPDIILVDLTMPGFDGLEFAQTIRQSPIIQSTFLIALSANVFDHNQEQSLAAGFNDFIKKPVDAEELLITIGQLLHLTWIQQDETLEQNHGIQVSDENLLPPTSQLHELLMITKQGNITAIRETILRFERSDKPYSTFTKELRRLADGFLMKQLSDFLTYSIERQANKGNAHEA